MKEEALKLADELEKPVTVPNQPDMIYMDGQRMYGAQMIRRLVEELDKQGYRTTHEGFSTIIDKVTPQLKPLSDEEIISEFTKTWDKGGNINGVFIRFARAIEERHGIK